VNDAGSDTTVPSFDSTVITVPTEAEIIAARIFPASPERVFAAFVTPELVVRWWGPVGWRTIVDEMDVRVGGQYRIRLLGPGGQVHRRTGTYREIVPGLLLVRTLEFGEFSGLTVVESIRFESVPGGTRVTLRTEFPSPAEPSRLTAAGIQNGVRSLFDRLATLLAEDPRDDGRP
jgi:uncharacterized protein YndB with AHSA1/START domain